MFKSIFFLVLVLDAVDNSGETHLQVDHNIYKRRLNLEGQPISDPEKSDGMIRFTLLMVISIKLGEHINYLVLTFYIFLV